MFENSYELQTLNERCISLIISYCLQFGWNEATADAFAEAVSNMYKIAVCRGTNGKFNVSIKKDAEIKGKTCF